MSHTEKINVLYVADKLTLGGSSIHGVTQLFASCIPQFDKDRYNVSLCSLRPRDKGGEYLEEKDIRVLYLDKGKFNPLTLTDLMKVIKKENTHILHLHGYGSTNFGRVCANLAGIPCIVHEHMYDKHMPLYQRMADRVLSPATTQAISVSESVKDFLVRHRSIPSEKVRVIYYGIPMNAFNGHTDTAGPAEKVSCKAQLNIPMSHKVVGIVGRLHAIKGHVYFLEAAQKVLQTFNDVTFVVVGDGDLMDSLREKSRVLGIEDRVIFTGYFEDLPGLLTEMDVKVISSLSEGVPFTLYEAMAAGCAVVSTKVGGISEVLIDGETGFLVPPKDPEALAKKILTLLNDSTLCQRMGAQAKKLSLQYDLKNTVHQMEEIYEQLYRKYYGNGK